MTVLCKDMKRFVRCTGILIEQSFCHFDVHEKFSTMTSAQWAINCNNLHLGFLLETASEVVQTLLDDQLC